MSEIGHFKKLVESIERKGLKEDWGSSDWYSVIKSMDEYIDKHGMNPETIMDAARDAALFWGDSMGHDMSTRDGEEDAIQDCKDGWMRMSERGQALSRMFAPVDEGISEAEEVGSYDYSFEVENPDYPDNGNLTVTITAGGHPVEKLDADDLARLTKKIFFAKKGRF